MKKKKYIIITLIVYVFLVVCLGIRNNNISKNIEIMNNNKYEESSVNEKVTENVNSSDICPIDVFFNKENNFDYTGTEQTYTVAVSGTYKIEVWGSAGSASLNGVAGYGGYSTGQIYLESGTTLYIYVGGTSGYNGGGSGQSTGGGATHIATKSGLLSTLSSSLSNIIIVAGGGGAAERETGGSGGGYIGVTGYVDTTNAYPYYGTGGSQNSGGTGVQATDKTAGGNLNGSFGAGGSGASSVDAGPGGGGGLYGGGATTYAGGAGGGSGYIGNSSLKEKVMYCYNCSTSSAESTKTVSTTCTSSTATSNCAKQGNGYAKITLIDI